MRVLHGHYTSIVRRVLRDASDEKLVRVAVDFEDKHEEYQNVIVLRDVSERLRGKRDFVPWFLCKRIYHGMVMDPLSMELQHDRSFILEVIRTDPTFPGGSWSKNFMWKPVKFPVWCYDDEEIVRETGLLVRASPRFSGETPARGVDGFWPSGLPSAHRPPNGRCTATPLGFRDPRAPKSRTL